MKLVTTTVGRKGPEDELQNQERFRAAEQALEKAVKLGAELMTLPAGFFTARSSQVRDAMANSLIGKAKQLGVAIVFGIDQEVKNPKTDGEIIAKGLLLPYYGYAWSRSEESIHCWQQRSSTSENQWLVSEAHCKEVRLIKVSGGFVGVLLCGEIFNQRIRHALAIESPRPRAIVDIAHIGSGFRVWQGMKKLAELGFTSACSVHTQRKYAIIKYCYTPEVGRKSTSIPDEYVFGPPRIELKLWTF